MTRKKKAPSKKQTPRPFLRRLLVPSGQDPYDTVEWENRTARIGPPEDPVFEQHDVEVPSTWSQNATNIVAQKYFAYADDDPRRERSVKQMIERVVGKITEEGKKAGYFRRREAEVFADELRYILLHQMASFNSPVWFNIGVQGAPQTSSACFILSVEDTLESITRWYAEEAKIFQAGSGAGVNVSALRGAGEALSRGGASSGPVTFMRAADTSAGTIQSGGVTRRAAKMVIIDDDHPDVEDFIWCKAREEERIRALAAAGFDMSMDSRAMAESTSYQNANQSVRISDDFMQALQEDEEWSLRARTDGHVTRTLPARKLMREIAEAAWRCADPGVQYDSTIQDWHTTPSEGRISASNPCSEFLSNDNTSCNLASLNLLSFASTDGDFDVERFQHVVDIMFLAQEITISFADFPTKTIGKRTRALRQIGIGYTNLGALLMSLGIPYDSEDGREWAASLTALLTGEAYRYSVRIAERMGPFELYGENRESMLRVLGKHRQATSALPRSGPAGKVARAARAAWKETTQQAEKHGVRNAQASVLAPTGCLTSDSMVMTDQGLARMDELGDVTGAKWQDVDFCVQTDQGSQQADRFFVNGDAAVVRVRTERSYSISGTPEHRIRKVGEGGGREWVRLSDVKEGDILPIRLGGMIGQRRQINLPPLDEPYFSGLKNAVAPDTMSPQLAELLGYFMGDGSLHAKGLRFQIAGTDLDLSGKLASLARDLFGLEAHYTSYENHLQMELHSTQLASWWRAAGFAKKKPSEKHSGKGQVPHVPAAIRASNDPEIYGAFLRGLYEADGGVYSGHSVSFSSAKEEFTREVKSMLLALGIPTQSKVDLPGNNHKGGGPVYVLRVLNRYFVQRFIAKVGFLSDRKSALLQQSKQGEAVPASCKRDRLPISKDMILELIPKNTQLRRNLLQSVRRGGVPRNAALQLYAETKDKRIADMLQYIYERVESVQLDGEEGTFDLSVPENVTYLANGFISHNTISFMLDCDTTGIEPDFALIKHKVLVGGGSLSIVNRSVPRALRSLGYSQDAVDEIIAYIEEEVDRGGMKAARGVVQGAPHLKEEHYGVFACAVGEGAISPEGHIQMMAATQPFLSGAISKTVNIPSDSTVDDIMQLYIDGWQLGLKAIAIYRDGSKSNQPLSDKKSKEESDAEDRLASLLGDGLRRGERRELPRDARVIGTKFEILSPSQQPVSGYIHVRLFEDGTPGGLFVDVGQAGSTLHGFIRAWSVTVGMGLQYGLPLHILVSKLAFSQFEPAGMTDDPEIRTAKSIVDYVVRWMAARFLESSSHEFLAIRTREDSQEENQEEESIPGGELQTSAKIVAPTQPAPQDMQVLGAFGDGVCGICSGTMIRTGTCMTCTSCGATGGCG